MPEASTEPDHSAETLRAVEELTGAEPVENGEELIGDPETRRKFREAKEAAARLEVGHSVARDTQSR